MTKEILENVMDRSLELTRLILDKYSNGDHSEIRTSVTNFTWEVDRLLVEVDKAFAEKAKIGSGWFSVNDRLPEADKPVLCFCEYQNVFQDHIKWTGQSIGAKNSYDNDFILDNDDTAFVRVTHWMHLPDDPK